MEPLRILHAITPAPVGGLESAVGLLACAQANAGHRVHVVATLDRHDEPGVVQHLRAAGVPVTTVFAPERAYVREWREVTSAIASLDPDVVHTHGFRADLLVGAAARQRNVPVVTT